MASLPAAVDRYAALTLPTRLIVGTASAPTSSTRPTTSRLPCQG
ncbi:hypothetical protein [Nocardia niwae]|nr:hypothetical protein [Nocardia niwae]